MDNGGDGNCDQDAYQVPGVGHYHRVLAEEHLREEYVYCEPGVAAHEGRHQHDLIAVAFVLERTGGHYGRHRAAEAQQHGYEGLAGEAKPAHDTLHDVGDARHIAAVLQKREAEEEYQDVRQEGHDCAHTCDYAVDDEGAYDLARVHRREQGAHRSAERVYAQLEPALEPVAHREGEEEGEGHDKQEDGDAPDPARQDGVGPLGEDVALLLVQKHLVDYLADKVVFLVDYVGLIAPVEHLREVHGVFLADLLVALEELERVPAVVLQVRIAPGELGDNLVNLVLNLVGVHHGVLAVVVVPVVRDLAVLVYEPVRMRLADVVLRRVHERVEAAALARRDGHDGDAQHLGQAVQVYLHAALFDDVHHVQRHDHGLAQLEELQSEVEAALERAGVHDVYHDVDLVREDEAARDGLLHRVAGERVGARQVDEVDVRAVEIEPPLDLLDRDARPVGHLEVRAGVGVEEGGLAAVGVADKAYRKFIRHCPRPPSPLCCA